MKVPAAVIQVLVTKKDLKEFKETIEAETKLEVTNPLKLLQACLQFDARDPATYAFLVADSGLLKKKAWPGVKRSKRK
jgi:hypothetical protein